MFSFYSFINLIISSSEGFFAIRIPWGLNRYFDGNSSTPNFIAVLASKPSGSINCVNLILSFSIAFNHLFVSVSIDIPIISILAVSMSLWSFTNFLLPNLHGAHHDAQKSISTYLPLKDVILTSLLVLLFNVIDGMASPI